MRAGLWWENVKETGLIEDLGVYGRIILKCLCRKWEGACIGLVWYRVGTSDGFL